MTRAVMSSRLWPLCSERFRNKRVNQNATAGSLKVEKWRLWVEPLLPNNTKPLQWAIKTLLIETVRDVMWIWGLKAKEKTQRINPVLCYEPRVWSSHPKIWFRSSHRVWVIYFYFVFRSRWKMTLQFFLVCIISLITLQSTRASKRDVFWLKRKFMSNVFIQTRLPPHTHTHGCNKPDVCVNSRWFSSVCKQCY